MTEELIELQPITIIAEIFTLESAIVGWRCLEGKENKDWIYLGDRKNMVWELN